MIETILGYKPEEIVGKKHIYDLLAPGIQEEFKKAASEMFRRQDMFCSILKRNLHKEGRTVCLSTSGEPILDKDGVLLGYRGVDTDITERMQMEEEKTKLIAELQSALADVKTLSGLLPICSACKRIRDDRGYWNQIEAYIHERSDAEFTHSICPECAKRLYPNLDTGDNYEPKTNRV